MSCGVTPASSNAALPDQAAPEKVRSTSPPDCPFTASPAPMTPTSGRARLFATSARVNTNAPPPSLITQQSSRCSGSATMGELSTSSTVTSSRSMACGLCRAWWEAATLTQASCSLVVPNSCMCRIAHIAYMLAVVGCAGNSQGISGCAALPTRGTVPVATPSLRGRPASVIRATLHLPAAIAVAAWATWIR